MPGTRSTYVIKTGKSPAREMRRVFASRIHNALARLADHPHADPDGLHEARKDIKRMRAMLRLLRGKALKPARKQLDTLLRDTGRRLSGDRDREVLTALLQGWREAAGPEGDPRLIGACRRLGGILRREGHPQAGVPPRRRRLAEKGLAEAAAAVEALPLAGLKRSHLCKAVRRAEESMLAAYGDYLRSPEMPALHEWRKRLKDCYYHLQLLREVLPVKAARLRRIRDLEGLLSDVRDCDLLLETLERTRGHGLGPRQQALLQRHATSRKERLLASALKHAKRELGAP